MSQDLHRPAYATRLGNLTAKSVLALIADQANVDGLGWPSVDYIVRMTEVDRRTVQRMLDVFAAIGLVTPGPMIERFGKMVPSLQINLVKLETDLTEEFIRAYAKLQGKVAELAEGRWRMKAKPVSETDAELVSEVSESVSETGELVSEVNKSVSEVKPPHPHIGRPPIDPLFDPLETQSACAGEGSERPSFDREQQEHLDRLAAEGKPDAVWREYYAEENRKAVEEGAAAVAEETALRREYPDLETALARMRKRCGFAWAEGDELGPVLRQVFADQEEMGKPVWRSAAQMVSAWELQRKQGPLLRARYGPLKFYRDGHWLDPSGWHWNTDLLAQQGGASAGMRR